MLNWVRQWGKAIQRLRKKQKPVKVEEVEIDELCTFVAQKNWLWVGVDRRGRKVLDFVVGGRGKSTGRRLHRRLMPYRPSIYYTDHWRAYPAVLLASRHRASKGETYTGESVNSLIRHDLARFHRRTRCFSRSVEMMVYSLELLFFLKVHGGWLERLSILS